MGTKDEFLFDNPAGVIFSFFAFMVTAFIFIYRILSVALIAPLGGLVVGSVMLLAWGKMTK